jgi:hypothetical protein
MPKHMGLRVAMEQQDGRPAAALDIVDLYAVDGAFVPFEAFKEHGRLPFVAGAL